MNYSQLKEQEKEIQQKLGLKVKRPNPLVNLNNMKQEEVFVNYINLVLSDTEISDKETQAFLDSLINNNPYLSFKTEYLPVIIDNTINSYATLNKYSVGNKEKFKIFFNLNKIKTYCLIGNDKLKNSLVCLFFSILSLGHEYTHYLQRIKKEGISKSGISSIRLANAFQNTNQNTNDAFKLKLRDKTLKLFRKTENKEEMVLSIYYTYPYEQEARKYSYIFLKTMMENIVQIFKERGEQNKVKLLLTQLDDFLQVDNTSENAILNAKTNYIKSMEFNIDKITALYNLMNEYANRSKRDEALYILYTQDDTDMIMQKSQDYQLAMNLLYSVSKEALPIFCANANLQEITIVFNEFIKLGYSEGITMIESCLRNKQNTAWANVNNGDTLENTIFKKDDILSRLASNNVTENTFKNIKWSETNFVGEEEYRNLVIQFFSDKKFAYLQHMLNYDLTHDEEIVAQVYTAVEKYINQIQEGDKNINPYDYNYLYRICSQFDDRDIKGILDLLASQIETFNDAIKNQTEDDWYNALINVYGETSATDIDLRRRYSQDPLSKMNMFMEEVKTTNKFLER